MGTFTDPKHAHPGISFGSPPPSPGGPQTYLIDVLIPVVVDVPLGEAALKDAVQVKDDEPLSAQCVGRVDGL